MDPPVPEMSVSSWKSGSTPAFTLAWARPTFCSLSPLQCLLKVHGFLHKHVHGKLSMRNSVLSNGRVWVPCGRRVFTLVPRVAGSLRFPVDVTCAVAVWADVPSVGFLCFPPARVGLAGGSAQPRLGPLPGDRLLLPGRVFALFHGLCLSRLT